MLWVIANDRSILYIIICIDWWIGRKSIIGKDDISLVEIDDRHEVFLYCLLSTIGFLFAILVDVKPYGSIDIFVKADNVKV